jgi:hypothetical protein
MLKRDLGLGHGDANTLTHVVLKANAGEADAGEASAAADPLDAIYTGPKAALRPIHDRLMAEITTLGAFEVAPKKGYVSLRRKKQFAMIGPATNSRVEVGLNAKHLDGSDRLEPMPPKGMCHYKVKLTDPDQVDAELIAWIRHAFEGAG